MQVFHEKQGRFEENKMGGGRVLGGQIPGARGQGGKITHPQIRHVQKSGKVAAILRGRNPTELINSTIISRSSLTQLEEDYLMVSVTASQIHHHPQPEDHRVIVCYVGHLWHDLNKAGFICLMNDIDQTTIDLKNTPN